MLHISLAAEKVLTIGGFPISNALLTTWVVMVLLTLFAIITSLRISTIPGTMQQVAEIAIDGLGSLFESIMHENYKRYFPLLATLFFFIITLNWAGLLPGVGTMGFFKSVEGTTEFTPLFRSGTADLNTTLALAIFVVVFIQIIGLRTFGAKYLGKFFNFKGPVDFFVGILELISELSRIISFAFRLFGNIFAGEVLLAVIAFLIPVLAPVPFLGLELFVGFIQALVFAMLTSVFLLIATSSEH